MKVLIIEDGAGSARVSQIDSIAEIILLDQRANIMQISRWIPYPALGRAQASPGSARRGSGTVPALEGRPVPVNDRPLALGGENCSGPLLHLAREMKALNGGESLIVTATNSVFADELATWCGRTGNVLEHCMDEGGTVTAVVRKRNRINA